MSTYKFTKVHNNHERLRDDLILCNTCSEIVVGKSVTLMAPPRDSGNLRLIETSPVISLTQITPDTVEIHTASGSIYHIQTDTFSPHIERVD